MISNADSDLIKSHKKALDQAQNERIKKMFLELQNFNVLHLSDIGFRKNKDL